ncbi:hypothetical protein [Demetria terragena]|uniref:hypothetical protein n=1 Tax=Demetria terragena TaxID=63959 RepID=UPI000360C09F|nr:hypothetical protein [Demetria terragena]
MPHRSSVALSTVALLALTACGPDTPEVSAPTTESTTAAAAQGSSTPTTGTSAAATTSATKTAKSPTRPSVPKKKRDVGTVRDGAPLTVQGAGDEAVSYDTGGDRAVVVELNCSKCSGPVLLTEASRYEPWFEGTGPAKTTQLESISERDDEKQLIVRAKGSWTLRLTSWNDLPIKPGPQSGKNDAVMIMSGPGKSIRLRATPSKGEALHFRIYHAPDTKKSRLIGGDEPLNESVDISLPAVVAVRGLGSWTLEPRP